MKRTVIEIRDIYYFDGKPHERGAYVWDFPDGSKTETWPRRTTKPTIVLIAPSDEACLRAVDLWMRHGRPSIEELRDNPISEPAGVNP